METIHVIDFEGNKRIGISEFGIVTLENFEIRSSELCVCQKKFHKYSEKFINLRKTGLFAAHSSQTEDSLLRHFWASPGSVPMFTDEEYTLSWGPWIDTKMIYRKLFRKLPSYELAELISAFELQKELLSTANKHCPSTRIGFHNSLFDAIATALLIKNLRKYFDNVSSKILAKDLQIRALH